MRHHTAIAIAALSLATPVAAQETLDLWARTDVGAFLPGIVEAFNASHETQIELQIIPPLELVQKYATAAAGGSAPELLSLDLVVTPALAITGQLADLTEIAHGLPYFEALSPAHIRVATYEDRIYGLPLSADSSVLLYNRKLYEQAGLDPDQPPTSYAEIAEHAAAIDALGDDIHGFYFSGACGGCNAFTFMPMVWASGGRLLSDDTRTVTLDTPQMRDAVELYRGMIADGLVPAGAQTDNGSNFFDAFAGDNIGIQFLGAFAIGGLNKNYPDLDYGVALIPGKDGGSASFAGGDNLVVTAGTENMAVVQEFLDFIYSVEGQQMLAKVTGVPVRQDVAERVLEGLDPRYRVASDAMAKGRTLASPVINDLINASTSPWTAFMGEVFYTDDVDGTFERIQDEMQSIIDFADY